MSNEKQSQKVSKVTWGISIFLLLGGVAMLAELSAPGIFAGLCLLLAGLILLPPLAQRLQRRYSLPIPFKGIQIAAAVLLFTVASPAITATTEPPTPQQAAQPTPTAVASPSPAQSPAADPWAEGVSAATQAAQQAQTAETEQEWTSVATLWTTASTAMGQVPAEHPQHATAQQKAGEYASNRDVAQQKIAQLQPAQASDNSSTRESLDSSVNTNLVVSCHRMIKDDLKNPRGAKFPGMFSDPTILIIDGQSVYKGWVEATNSFGATIRSNFLCVGDMEGNAMEGNAMEYGMVD